MSKELSIKGIKKEIIDKILDSTYIIGLFDMKYHGFKSISELKDAYIFDYARIEPYGDFISIDLSKIKTRLEVSGNGLSAFDVSIMFGLDRITKDNENRLDSISETIESIIHELYPRNKNYRDIFSLQNIPLSAGVYESRTIRKITFTIE